MRGSGSVCSTWRHGFTAAGWTLVALLACLAIDGSLPIGAQPEPSASGSPATVKPCDTPAACFAELAAAQRSITSITADFTQTKRIALLREPLVSRGRFVFVRPDRVRWDVVSPEPLTIEIVGSRLRVGEGGELRVVEAHEGTGMFREMAGLFTGADPSASARFVIDQGSRGRASFVLRPRSPELERVVRAIELDADPESGRPRRAVFRETNGDETEVELSNVRINPEIDPGLFK